MNISFYTRVLTVLLISMILVLIGCAKTQVRPEPPNLTFVERIERKWDTVKLPAAKVWVDYNENVDTRSEVNFMKGTVTLETVVPKQVKDVKKEGEKKIAAQVKKVFSSGINLQALVLKDQVRDEYGEIVTNRNVDRYIIKEVIPRIKIKPVSFIAKDGVERLKLDTQFNLVPDHLKIRVKQYSGIINRYARRFKLEPQLVMAIIHKESHFNPLARSHGGALGLMQLMPEYGAKEAYDFLYNKKKLLPDIYFYNPENNIELGTAYFHLLKDRHFKKVKNRLKKRYLALCAYNWGPTRIKKLMNKHKISRMNSQQVYALLKSKTPQETKDYLENVVRLSREYEKLIIEMNMENIKSSTALNFKESSLNNFPV